MEYTKHYSVLLNEVLEAFKQIDGEKLAFADLTFGGGGHTFEIAETFNESKVYCIDQDPQAYENGLERIKNENREKQIILKKGNFEDFQKIHELENESLDGIVMDLGVSSHHFDSAERGFSFRFDGPLDMRMAVDNENINTASYVVNNFSKEELSKIFFEYGEERLAGKIAQSIIETRKEKPIETTKELENIVFHCYPKNQRHQKTHPATRTFQALRIFVNRELDVLSDSIGRLIPLLKPGGCIAIISFHSIEDRIVKTKFKEIEKDNERVVKILTKKPIIPSNNEIFENSRSRSAKLRVLGKYSRKEIELGHNSKKKKNKYC